MKRQAEQTYPNECCGLMLGICAVEATTSENKVVELYPAVNVWDSDLTNQAPEQQNATTDRRYRIDPAAMLAAQQYARTNGWDIIGIYHSHPNHAAVPSEWDRMWAWPQYSYAIVSLKNGTARDVQSWILNTDHEFLPERLMVIG
jgi:proteasome lid subunit RPN8/RPN11